MKSALPWTINPAVLILIAISMLAASCAEVGPPPGGEVDKAGPYLIDAFPPDSALAVPVGSEINLVFSEPLLISGDKQYIYISPRPDEKPKINWKSDRVFIELAESFVPDQTYVVVVSSELTDLRRNPLEGVDAIAFSTGEELDTGSVAGVVLKDGSPATNFMVGLYPDQELTDTARFDSIYPEYLTTTNSEGKFRFRSLPDGSFRLLAFKDKNHDEFFNLYRESFAVPDREIIVGGSIGLGNLMMPVTKHDSTTPGLLSVVATNNHLLRIRLNRPIDPTTLSRRPQGLQLQALDTNLVYTGSGLLETPDKPTTVLTFSVNDLRSGRYRIELQYAPDQPVLVRDSASFKFDDDRQVPTLVLIEPGEGSVTSDLTELRLNFSEAIDTTKVTSQTLALWAGDAVRVPLRYYWDDPFRLVVKPAKIEPGTSYRLDLTEFDIADLAGNQLGDSLKSYQFSTIGDDSLGSVSGQVRIGLADRASSPVSLTFTNTATRAEHHLRIQTARSAGDSAPDRAFVLALPPGKYLLGGFIDSDADGTRTVGSILPYRPCETQAVYPDTVRIRARFETAGIDFFFD